MMAVRIMAAVRRPLIRVSVEMKKPPNTDRIGGEVGDVVNFRGILPTG